MLNNPASDFSTTVSALIVCAFVVSVIRAAFLFSQGFEQGFGSRRHSDLQTIFSSDE